MGSTSRSSLHTSSYGEETTTLTSVLSLNSCKVAPARANSESWPMILYHVESILLTQRQTVNLARQVLDGSDAHTVWSWKKPTQTMDHQARSPPVSHQEGKVSPDASTNAHDKD